MNNKTIGVFDSGLGGLSVVKEIKKLMPNEHIIYFGDSANAPYGTKSTDEVLELSRAVAKKLQSFEVKAIVVACNTASSAAGKALRKELDIPIILMEPALKPAVKACPEGKILVLATAVTLREKKFQKLLARFQHANITLLPAGELVEIVESQQFEQTQATLENLSPTKDYDAVVLGCTHYVFLKEQIQQYFKAATIFDGNLGTAKQLQSRLAKADLLSDNNSGKIEILNSNSAMLKRSHELLNDPVSQLKEITVQIKDLLENGNFNEIEKELMQLKYLQNKKINFRLLARKHNKTIKYIESAFKKSDNRLYKLLKDNY